MRICLFGSYQSSTNGIPSGPGGDLIGEICRSQEFKVIECREDCRTYASVIGSFLRLFLRHRRMAYDIMIIPYRGIITFPLARLVCRKPIIYFPAFSIYDTLTNDRKKMDKDSIKARIIRYIDKTACRWSDLVILESTAAIEYFMSEFGLPREKFGQLWLSAYEPLFEPLPFKEQRDEFVVLYFGKFIPLHGVKTIIRSAKQLSEVTFVFCGDGQDRQEIEEYAKRNNMANVRFLGMVSTQRLLDSIDGSDVCLGTFGTSRKSRTVLTNKVHQILASAKPLITMKTDVTAEAGLEDGENCLLVRSASHEDLSKGILLLKNDADLRRRIAEQGRRPYMENMSISQTGKRLAGYIRACTEGRESA